jgi:hypothetical protein
MKTTPGLRDVGATTIMDAILWRYGKDQGITGGRSSTPGIAS